MEHEAHDDLQQQRLQRSHSWRLEEPADELSIFPWQQRPEQAPAACAVPPGGHHATGNHSMGDTWQRHAGGSRPGSHGAWPGMQPNSHGSSATASSAIWLDASEAQPCGQTTAHSLDKEQDLQEGLPAAPHSADGEPGMHVDKETSSRVSHEPLPKMTSAAGPQPAQHGMENITLAAGLCAAVADTIVTDSMRGSDGWAHQEAADGMPWHMERHASAAGSQQSMLPVALPDPSHGQVQELPQLAAEPAAQEAESTSDSTATVPDQNLQAAGQVSTALQELGPTPSDDVVSLSEYGQSNWPQSGGLALASLQDVVPGQEWHLSDSKAALSVIDPSATNQLGAVHASSGGLQPAIDNHQDAAGLGCFAEQCSAAMQESGSEAKAPGRPLSAASLGRHAVAASSSLQGVAESRSVWMQLSVVFSEADSLLEAATGSCSGSFSSCPSHSEQAGHNSPHSGQGAAQEDADTAHATEDPETASCGAMPCSMLPAEASDGHAASAIQGDADLHGEAIKAQHHVLGHGRCQPAYSGSFFCSSSS